MTKIYTGAAALAAALMLGVAAHAAQAAGPTQLSSPSADSLVTQVQAGREGGGGGGGGGGGKGGGGGGSSGGGGGASRGDGGGGAMSSGGRGAGGGGGSVSRSGGDRGSMSRGGGERGSMNRGGSERGFATRGDRGDRGDRAGRRGDRDRVGSNRRNWDGDRGDRRGRHRYTRHRGGVGIYIGPGYGYYYGDYDDSCEWLRRRAINTGSSYWWRRFRDCVY